MSKNYSILTADLARRPELYGQMWNVAAKHGEPLTITDGAVTRITVAGDAA